jgi:PAS domain S-box-containing protein
MLYNIGMNINKQLLFIVITLFVSIFSFAIFSDMGSISRKISNIQQVDSKLKTVQKFKNLIQEIQRERGLSNIYSSAKRDETLLLLKKQRASTDKTLLKTNFLKEVISIRLGSDSGSYTQEQTFNLYTKLIFDMLLETKKLLLLINDQNIKNHFIIYQNSNLAQEYLGEIRAEIGAIIEDKKILNKKYVSVIKLQTLVQNYIHQNRQNIALIKVKIDDPLQSSCFIGTNNIIQNIVERDLKHVTISSIEWFKLSSCAINFIDIAMTTYLSDIQNQIDTRVENFKSDFYFHLLFWSISFILSLFLTLLLFRTNKKVLEKQRLLEDYKKAIDNSTIVSKTDKHGIITYANQAFCDISGYTTQELIGKPHNIVRHPSVEKEAFKGLWSTIKSGHTWSGQIPNLAKDKSTYWVNASISPIYDNDNNLVEYIAIRHDITELKELNKEIKNTQYELIYRMGESVESRSKESGHHIQRVAHYSKLLAQFYGLSNQEADTIFIASTMHDMGKIAIPDSILLKRDKLTKDEWEIMQTHAAIGYKILAGSNLPILKMAADIAYGHHEHYNGNGYPRGIKKEEISIHARIVAIADVFDALISERVYKKAWPLEKVLNLFKEERGEQFDPNLVDLFLSNSSEFIKIKEQFED